jgi:hypothetical protein
MLKQLLPIAAIAAISFSASADVNILDSFGTSGWDSSYDETTKTITYDSDWTGRGWWLGGVDYSDYESVVVEFATPLEATAQIVVEYVKELGVDNTTAAGGAGTEKLECQFNKDGITQVNQIYIQSSAAGTIVLKDAYLVSATGATEKLIFEGEEAMSWWPGYEIDKSLIVNQGAGSKLVIDVDYPAENDTWSLKLGISWTGSVLPSFKNEENFQEEYNTIYMSAKSYTYTFTEEDIVALKNDGDSSLRLCSESSTTLKKVNLIYPDESGVNNVEVVDSENAPVEYYNLQGVRVVNPQNGLYIKRQGNKATKVLVK